MLLDADRLIAEGKICVVFQQGVLVKSSPKEHPWQVIHHQTGLRC